MDFLPMPHHVRRLEGRFCIRYNGCIMLQDTEPSALLYARMLRDTIREETGLVLSIRRGQGEAGDIVLRPDQELAERAYRVHVLPEGVTVSGGSDEALRLIPPKQMSLEACIEYIGDDELIEVTPKSLRIRKRILNNQLRAKASSKK